MIGPTSETSGVKNPGDDGQAKNKRKLYEELEMESFCNELCHENGFKRYIPDLNILPDNPSIEGCFESTELSSNAQGLMEEGSVTRLEVLVVDGNWDAANLTDNHLTELTTIVASNDSAVEFSQAQSTAMHNFDEPPPPPSYWDMTGPSTATFNANSANNNFAKTSATFNAPTTFQPQLEDQENGNLSWLLDFKLDSLIEAAEDRVIGPKFQCNSGSRSKISVKSNATLFANDANKRAVFSNSMGNGQADNSSNLHAAENDNRNYSAARSNGPKKPPFTYTELIEHALQEKGELTVSAIYQWISEHFPYYKSNDDRWKNSVRHNLSINPHFRKGSKAPHGAGHLWAIASRCEPRPRPLNNVSAALGTNTRHSYRNSAEIVDNNDSTRNNQVVIMDEVALATASIAQAQEECQMNEEVIRNVSVTLEHCAEQILNGIKRDVEVQYLVPMSLVENEDPQVQQHVTSTDQNCSLKETVHYNNFLNPVSKEIVAEECGLIGEDYLVTDLNPACLGLNIDPDAINPDNDFNFGEELSFQFYELTSPSQLQSA